MLKIRNYGILLVSAVNSAYIVIVMQTLNIGLTKVLIEQFLEDGGQERVEGKEEQTSVWWMKQEQRGLVPHLSQ